MSLDGKLPRTFALFLRHPGRLDHHYHVGRRVGYFKPVSLFLLVNVLFVMLSPISDFYVTFSDQMQLQSYSPWLRPVIEGNLTRSGQDVALFAQHYDQLVKVLARSLIILQVPFFAAFAALMFRKAGYYSGDHLTFSLNAHSWLMLWIVVAQLPAYTLSALASPVFPVSVGTLYFIFLPAGFAAYLLVACRTLYEMTWWQVAWRLPLILLGYHVSHVCYRLCQLLITVSLVELPG